MRTSCVLMSLRSPAKWNHWKVNKHNCWDLSVETLVLKWVFANSQLPDCNEYKYREVLLTLFIMLRKKVNKRKLSLTHFRSQKSNLTRVFLWKQKSVKFLFSKWEKKIYENEVCQIFVYKMRETKSVKTKFVKFCLLNERL